MAARHRHTAREPRGAEVGERERKTLRVLELEALGSGHRETFMLKINEGSVWVKRQRDALGMALLLNHEHRTNGNDDDTAA
jgi:hypothetical protein